MSPFSMGAAGAIPGLSGGAKTGGGLFGGLSGLGGMGGMGGAIPMLMNGGTGMGLIDVMNGKSGMFGQGNQPQNVQGGPDLAQENETLKRLVRALMSGGGQQGIGAPQIAPQNGGGY